MIVNPNKLPDTSSPETSTHPPPHLLSLKPHEEHEQRHSPLSDEGCNLGQSPYSSDDNEDNEDNISIRTTSTMIERTKRKDKVARSASSDSALGLEVEVDDPMMDVGSTTTITTTTAIVPPNGQPQQQQQQRRMTLTVTDLPLRPALLPLAEPTALPDSPTGDLQATLLMQTTPLAQSAVPSKVLLEERVIEIPETTAATTSTINSMMMMMTSTTTTSGGSPLSSSRRESAQSCISDYPNSECSGVRYVRTPSVVVSDYSDDVMCGITLEEIEYFRAQRMRRRRSSLDTAGGGGCGGVVGYGYNYNNNSNNNYGNNDRDASDVSASSSCSNLYYCGSTISALDGAECYVNGMRMSLAERKVSDCSTCSAASGDDDDNNIIIGGGGGSNDGFTIHEQSQMQSPLQTRHLSIGDGATAMTSSTELADLLAGQHLNARQQEQQQQQQQQQYQQQQQQQQQQHHRQKKVGGSRCEECGGVVVARASGKSGSNSGITIGNIGINIGNSGINIDNTGSNIGNGSNSDNGKGVLGLSLAPHD